MKLLELKIEGFRSLRNVVWKPGDLNVLIGPNAGGKSNLLKALHMLAASAQGDLSRQVFNREGGMGAIVWNGEAPSVVFSLKVDIGGNSGLNLDYDLWIERAGASASYRIATERAFSSQLALPNTSNGHLVFDRVGGHAMLVGPNALPLHRIEIDMRGQDEAAIRLAAHPSLPDTAEGALAGMFATDMGAWKIHYDFRTDARASIRESPVARDERSLDSDGDNLTNVLHTLYTNNRQFESELDGAMSAAFGEEYVKLVFSPDAGDQRVQLRVRWKHLNQDRSQSDLSDGTLRFLYLMAILANPKPPPLIAIDEPETGLHPSMLRIVAEFAGRAATRSQVILSTHSAELLDALSEFKPTTHIVEAQNGETQVRTLAGEKLEYWLSKYSLGELYRTSGLEAAT